MNKHRLLYIALPLITFLGLNSCIKDGNETIIYLGYENYIPTIETVIPQELLNVYSDSIGEIHRGFIPPNVEGKFIISPKQRVLSNNLLSWPYEVVEPDMTISISNQHNGVIVNFDCSEATLTSTDSVFIMGHDNCFTIYFKETKEFVDEGYTTVITRAMILTGEITAEGIKNLIYADMIIDVYDDSNGLIVQYPSGQYFIYKDGDGLSTRL